MMYKSIVSAFVAFVILCTGIIVLADNKIESLQNSDPIAAHNKYDWRQYKQSHNDNFSNETTEILGIDFKYQKNADTYVENKNLIWQSGRGEVCWEKNFNESGWYKISINYCGIKGNNQDIEMGLKLDNEFPYSNLERFSLPRIWADDKEKKTDFKGNDIVPKQVEIKEFQTQNINDLDGFETEDLGIYINKGVHIISLISYTEPFMLHSIIFLPNKELLNIDQFYNFAKNNNIFEYKDEDIIIEAEDAFRKSSSSLVPLSDSSSSSPQPSNAFVQKLNYIGGANWCLPGQKIDWQVKVPKDGLYKLGINYRQTYLENGTSYRSLEINGECQYKNMGKIAFPYQRNWKVEDSFNNGDEIVIYLKKGINTISLTATLGEMSDYCYYVQSIVSELGNMYREIVMIISDKPDNNRDYKLFSRIPDLEQRMKKLCDEMNSVINKIKTEHKDIDTTSIILKKMVAVLERMMKRKFEAQRHKSTFYDAYSGLSSQVQELRNMGLDIDCLILSTPGKNINVRQSTIVKKAQYGIKRFLSSFLIDYNTSSNTQNNTEKITIWANWGRDQIMVLNSLLISDFTPKNNISVDVKMTNASILQAILAGSGPDCTLSEARTAPINMAMRGALVDLKQFDDFAEVMNSFAKTSENPYSYKGRVYGLPSTQQFFMLYYRKDIFKEFGLSVPKTWEEFLEVSRIFSLNNLEVGLPYTPLTDISQTDNGITALNIFPVFMQQNSLSLYNKSLSATTLTDIKTISVFNFWTDFYTLHNFPKEYSFFNRFRVGLMPMSIQGYNQYAVLTAAAPEIKGDWAMAEIPGIINNNGTINNEETGYGTAAVILNQSKHKDSAWKLLKWWTSEDVQYNYSFNIESVLGSSGRYTTANQKAMSRLGWDPDSGKALMSQWNKVIEIPEVPGGYYVSRAVDQAFWNVVNMGKIPREQLVKWGEVADAEINKKVEQYK